MRLTRGVNSIFAEHERRVTADLESGFLVAKSTKRAALYRNVMRHTQKQKVPAAIWQPGRL